MIAPRVEPENINKKHLLFLGGTENFDLWWHMHSTRIHLSIEMHQLRIQRVGGAGKHTWDSFKTPLRVNKECNPSMPPLERTISGYWGDVILTMQDVDTIETYLGCFAPWVFEQ